MVTLFQAFFHLFTVSVTQAPCYLSLVETFSADSDGSCRFVSVVLGTQDLDLGTWLSPHEYEWWRGQWWEVLYV